MAAVTYASSTVTYGDSLYSYIGGLMSDRYWVAAADGVWNDTANWSTTSGGGGGASVPVAGDNVYFDTGSQKKCTLNRDEACALITWNAFCVLDVSTFRLNHTGLLFI